MRSQWCRAVFFNNTGTIDSMSGRAHTSFLSLSNNGSIAQLQSYKTKADPQKKVGQKIYLYSKI